MTALLLTLLSLALCALFVFRWLSYTKLRRCAAALERIDGALSAAVRSHLREPWQEYHAIVEDCDGSIMLLKKSVVGTSGSVRRMTVRDGSMVCRIGSGTFEGRWRPTQERLHKIVERGNETLDGGAARGMLSGVKGWDVFFDQPGTDAFDVVRSDEESRQSSIEKD